MDFLAISVECNHKCSSGSPRRPKKSLMSHAWPGNVRELRNTIERAVILGSSERIDDSRSSRTTSLPPPALQPLATRCPCPPSKSCILEESWPTPPRSRKRRTFWVSTRRRSGAGGRPTVSDSPFHFHWPCILQGHFYPAFQVSRPLPSLYHNPLKILALGYGTPVALVPGADGNLTEDCVP